MSVATAVMRNILEQIYCGAVPSCLPSAFSYTAYQLSILASAVSFSLTLNDVKTILFVTYNTLSRGVNLADTEDLQKILAGAA